MFGCRWGNQTTAISMCATIFCRYFVWKIDCIDCLSPLSSFSLRPTVGKWREKQKSVNEWKRKTKSNTREMIDRGIHQNRIKMWWMRNSAPIDVEQTVQTLYNMFIKWLWIIHSAQLGESETASKVWFAFNWLCVIFKFTHFNFCREGNYRNVFNNCCAQYFASVCQPNNASVLHAVRIRFHWPDCFNSIVVVVVVFF